MPVSTDGLLERHPLLARIEPERVQTIAQAGDLESFLSGEIIVAEGTPADAMYLLLSGRVEVCKGDNQLATLVPGDFFGEMSLLQPGSRTATVVALDAAHLFRLPYFALQNLLEQDPQAMNAVLVQVVRVLSERLRRTNDLLGSIDRLADFLAGSLV